MKKLNILFVDDDEVERMKFSRVCKKSDHHLSVTEAKNGEEALNKLKNTSLSQLIFLDLNMPKMNGIEFLEILKSDEQLKYIPIIILTSSDNNKDLKKCYELGIAGYIVKPVRYEEYINHISKTLDYWTSNELVSQII
ncbi:response regulator [Tenacibaculum sp. M341]|uniref:response regulator n=1 Tax=Tenacibaculum sp. M341 TaxID=2530339 RepID=UPI00104C5556|nr:response regulator [Tenacibaculum sp. M341]TCI92623.1 response regulator [Tenacibaculum sp. M341]